MLVKMHFSQYMFIYNTPNHDLLTVVHNSQMYPRGGQST